MSKFNFLVNLNTYSDSRSSNSSSLQNFKWTRCISGVSVSSPVSQAFSLAPGESKILFNGSRTLSQNGTTQYTLAPKPGFPVTYVLTATAAAFPNFHTPRTTGADATTQVTITTNGPLMTIISTSGTPLSLISGGAIVGDHTRIGDQFNTANQGEFKILSLTATSLTVENNSAVAEGPITLGAGFATQLQIYSALGVQVGDTLVISGGFSLVTQGSYVLSSVAGNFLEFNSANSLPTEGPITTQAITVYTNAKQLVYLESDKYCSIDINGTATDDIKPLVPCSCAIPGQPGIFVRTSTIYSMSVTNLSTDTANLFLAAVE